MTRVVRGMHLLLWVPRTWLACVSGYLGVLTVAAWTAKRRGAVATDLSTEPQHRFAVLVPAHDEERGVGATLRSLAELDYPRSRYSVHLVADNCTDSTADVARTHGVHVHERVDPLSPGKGPALSWLLRRLDDAGQQYDAVAIIDADSIVCPSFLRVMDAKLASGARVVQGHYAVRNVDDSWVAALRSAALAVRHYLRPLARTFLGGSAGLHGNGMVFAAEAIRDRPWRAHLTEDIEMEAELLLQGERVVFAPDATVRAEMPARLADARSQHQRWERGRFEVAARHVPHLLHAAIAPSTTHRLRYVDSAVDHLVPPLSVVTSLSAAVGGASVVLWLLDRTRSSRRGLIVSLGVGLAQTAYVASGLVLVRAPRSVWMALLRTPLYVVWKVPVWLRALRTAPTSWVRTTRSV